jgi:hypothetical protein
MITGLRYMALWREVKMIKVLSFSSTLTPRRRLIKGALIFKSKERMEEYRAELWRNLCKKHGIKFDASDAPDNVYLEKAPPNYKPNET